MSNLTIDTRVAYRCKDPSHRTGGLLALRALSRLFSSCSANTCLQRLGEGRGPLLVYWLHFLALLASIFCLLLVV